MTERGRKWAAAVAFCLFLLFCVLITVFVGVPFARMADDPASFQAWVESFGLLGKLVFIFLVAFQVVIALIPGEPIELAAGYCFGFWQGTLLAQIGIVLGSAVVFLLVRKFGRMLIEIFFSQKKINKLRFLQNSKKVKVITFLLLLIPGTPKDLLSYFAGLTPLRLYQWLLIVFVARLPSLVTSTATGAAAGERNLPLTVMMAIITVVISVAGLIYYHHICNENIEEREKTEHCA